MEEVTRTVAEIMSGVLLYQNADATIFEVLDIMHRNNADAIVVMHNGMPRGIITEEEIVRGLLRSRERFYDLLAMDVMRSPLLTLNHDSSIEEAKDVMFNANIAKIPVKRDDNLIGLVTQKDIISYLF